MLSELVYESSLRVFALWWSLNSILWHHGIHICSHARIHARLYARTGTRVHAWTHPRKHTHTHTHAQANECVFMGPRTMFLQGLVFARKSTLRTLRHSRSVAPHSIKAKLATLFASVSSRAKKWSAYAPTASHWTLPTLPLCGVRVGYVICDFLVTRVFWHTPE